MRQRSKKWLIVPGVAGLLLLGFLAVTLYQLRAERDHLALELERSENRGRLLNEKYQEEKAAVGRLQRENLMLEGRVRQAVMDMEQYAAENERLEAAHQAMEARLAEAAARCENRQQALVDNIQQWKEAHQRIEERYRQNAARLAALEKEKTALEDQVRHLDGELGRALTQGRRYHAHNERLVDIARTLVGQVERDRLGTSIIVREPLVQFKRVELEQLLQEYLDRIDEEKIRQ